MCTYAIHRGMTGFLYFSGHDYWTRLFVGILQNGSKGANHNEFNKKLVLVGNGMAGLRTIEHILKLAPHAYEITIFGAEPHPNYNRIMLSSVLAGGTSIEDIVINDWNWYEENNIRVYPGDPVVQIDAERKEVVSESGVRASYDELIMATGSSAFILPSQGLIKKASLASVILRIAKP